MAREPVVHLQIGQVDSGIWCDHCLLPCAVSWTLYGITPGGVMNLGIMHSCMNRGCPEHLTERRAHRQAGQRVADALGGGTVFEEEGPQ